MATLARLNPFVSRSRQAPLDPRIPEPFPSHVLREQQFQQDLLDELAGEDLVLDPILTTPEQNGSHTAEPSIRKSLQSVQSDAQYSDDQHSQELLPSIIYVQQSCLMTLNNLLSGSPMSKAEWQPILPSRRHSMPSRPVPNPDPDANAVSSSSALHTLVTNLRNRDPEQMLEVASPTNDAALISELQGRVEDLSSMLSVRDADLIRALVSLLAHVNRLSAIDPRTFGARQDNPATSRLSPVDQHGVGNIYAELKRQVSDLQVQRLDREMQSHSASPVLTVEVALLWTKIDQDLETVLTLCRERPELAPRTSSPEHLPPEYDSTEHDLHLPPEYDLGTAGDFHQSSMKPRASTSSFIQVAGGSSEKMRLDLEAVTMAIDRLYLVAPQLHSQRVELKKGKLEEMERARLSGPSIETSKSARAGKGKEKDLEKMLDLLGKASGRRLVEQSVMLDGDMSVRLKKAQQRDNEKRDAFVERLIRHSGSRRLHSQDAILHLSKIRNPDAMLTLPEFIREAIPEHLQTPDPEALLTLPEFVKEPPPERHSPPTGARLHKKPPKPSRSRSMSAPPLAWLIPSLSRSGSPVPQNDLDKDDFSNSYRAGLTVRYVAEHHENLQHVLCFLGVDGMTPGVDLEAEVPLMLGHNMGATTLILKCGTATSMPLPLPARVVPGKKEVRVQSGHYEVKLATSPAHAKSPPHSPEDTFILDASELAGLKPTSLICSSCSLALVHTSDTLLYHDLPSEHWSELLEAWMCHRDQKLHDQVSKHAKGFWPLPGQAFVGGSYILFEESSVAHVNIRIADVPKQGEEWRRVSCICGAVVGRCQPRPSSDGIPSQIYRFAKYALRPVSPTAGPCRLPFSAFILEDMMELVHAHATYRFIILDEEEERPRLLLWLFKPNIHLAYATTAQFALPKSGSIRAAKILFKILGPESPSRDLQRILDKYPGFPQAERLLYPIDICRRLAGLLRESNTSYPIGMRVMTGLLVGWLQRS